MRQELIDFVVLQVEDVLPQITQLVFGIGMVEGIELVVREAGSIAAEQAVENVLEAVLMGRDVGSEIHAAIKKSAGNSAALRVELEQDMPEKRGGIAEVAGGEHQAQRLDPVIVGVCKIGRA